MKAFYLIMFASLVFLTGCSAQREEKISANLQEDYDKVVVKVKDRLVVSQNLFEEDAPQNGHDEGGGLLSAELEKRISDANAHERQFEAVRNRCTE